MYKKRHIFFGVNDESYFVLLSLLLVPTDASTPSIDATQHVIKL